MVNDFRGELYAHLQRLSLAFHSRREVGDLLFRLTADTFAIQTLTMNGFFPILTSIVLLGGMMIVMFRLDVAMTLVALAIVPILFAAIVTLSSRINALAADARVKESALWAVAQRTIGAIRVIQAFTTEQVEHRRFVDTSSASLDANLQTTVLSQDAVVATTHTELMDSNPTYREIVLSQLTEQEAAA